MYHSLATTTKKSINHAAIISINYTTVCIFFRNIFTDVHQNLTALFQLHAQTFVPSKF